MKEFALRVLTPEREFYSGNVEAVGMMLTDGSVTIYADHMPMVAPVAICDLKIKEKGIWREAFASEGFMEIRRTPRKTRAGSNCMVMLFLQTCEWPEEIDERRAEEALLRAEERLRQKRSIAENKQLHIDLARAMERLRVSKLRK